MKKILSAVLAAAMVLSMGVMAFAADAVFGEGTATPVPILENVWTDRNNNKHSNITFDKVFVARNGGTTAVQVNQGYDKLEAGDVLYFPVRETNDGITVSDYAADAPRNWQIKINNAEYVDNADFYFTTSTPSITGLSANVLYVKVTLSDFNDFENSNVNFYFYIYDKTNKTRSDRAVVKYEMNGYNATLTEDDLDWVITVAGPKAYKYDSKAKAKNATFDFNGAAFVEVKLFPGETYKVNVNTKYDKDIARLYPEADFEFVELSGDFDKVADVVLPSSKDNKFIYEVVDGDLVAVDAEYVKGHKFDSGEKVNGYLFTTNELGKYAISDVELDLEDEDIDLDDDTTSAPVEDNKKNPPMGANDFVGAAVALAVVSVAAAGALALKK